MPAGTSTGSHVRSFGRQRQHLILRAAQHHAVQLHGQLLEVRRAVRLPAVVGLLGGAIALRKREEAPSERVADQLQQHEQVARPVRQRRAGQQVHGRLPRRVRRRVFSELARELAAGARVVLQVVRLVEHEPRPRHAPERTDVLRQDVVVHDRPFRIGHGRCAAAFDDADGGAGDRLLDLARPVALHRGGADDEIRPAGGGMAEGHDRLPRLAEPHVVGEDGAAAAEQERDAFNLMRKEPLAERDGLPVGAVQVVRRQAEELRKSGGLCVELIGLRLDRA